jgi:hypothetical protein
MKIKIGMKLHVNKHTTYKVLAIHEDYMWVKVESVGLYDPYATVWIKHAQWCLKSEQWSGEIE